MRNIFVIILALLLSSALSTSEAQVTFDVNVNLDSQPVWGPAGYDYVENYYLPDMDVYYNVRQHRYYYINNGVWVNNTNLPKHYRSYNIYNSYKVVINDKDPWEHHDKYSKEYSKYKGKHNQKVIRDSHDARYFKNKNHPEHNNWAKKQKQVNGKKKDKVKGRK